jgi:signal transduction histidine kinase/HAMP domain-containing protein
MTNETGSGEVFVRGLADEAPPAAPRRSVRMGRLLGVLGAAAIAVAGWSVAELVAAQRAEQRASHLLAAMLETALRRPSAVPAVDALPALRGRHALASATAAAAARRAAFATATLGALLLGWIALAAVALERRVRRPLAHLSAVAEQWAAGDLAARAGVAGGEVGRLAARLDAMVDTMQATLVSRDRLDSLRFELQAANAVLREEVEQRAHVEHRLREAAEEWRATFDAVDGILLVADAGGRIVLVNQLGRRDLHELPGLAAGSPLSSQLLEREPWPTMARLVEQVSRRGEAGVETAQEGGSERRWRVTANPLGSSGEVLAMARDVTRVTELERSLATSERLAALGEITVSLAHEVRNPLFAISATVEAMQATITDNPLLADDIAALGAEVDRLSALMSDLLELGRPPTSALSTLDLGELAARAVEECAGLAAERVELRGEEPLPGAFEPRRAVVAIANVVRNALQLTPPPGRVWVTLSRAERGGVAHLSCAVADEGPGFTGEALARAFEPFFTRRKRGTGLGLAIVRRIVEDEHGGVVRLANRDGGGAEVTLLFPAVTATPPAAGPATRSEVTPRD